MTPSPSVSSASSSLRLEDEHPGHRGERRDRAMATQDGSRDVRVGRGEIDRPTGERRARLGVDRMNTTAVVAAGHEHPAARDDRGREVHQPVGDVVPARGAGLRVERVVAPAIRAHHDQAASDRRGRVAELLHHVGALPDDAAGLTRQAQHVTLGKSRGHDDVTVDRCRRRQDDAAHVAGPQHRTVAEPQGHDPILERRDEDATARDRGRPVHGRSGGGLPDGRSVFRAQAADQAVEIDRHQESVGDAGAREHAADVLEGGGPARASERRARALGRQAAVGGVEPRRAPVIRARGARPGAQNHPGGRRAAEAAKSMRRVSGHAGHGVSCSWKSGP